MLQHAIYCNPFTYNKATRSSHVSDDDEPSGNQHHSAISWSHSIGCNAVCGCFCNVAMSERREDVYIRVRVLGFGNNCSSRDMMVLQQM